MPRSQATRRRSSRTTPTAGTNARKRTCISSWGRRRRKKGGAGAAAMLGKSRIGLKRLFLHPCFTVGYGSKDHSTMPYYGLLAAVYGDGRPVRLANDRFDQFQAGLKRHQFSMGYTVAVERRTG